MLHLYLLLEAGFPDKHYDTRYTEPISLQSSAAAVSFLTERDWRPLPLELALVKT